MRREQVGDDSGVPEDHASSSGDAAVEDVAQLRAALAAAEARIAALEQIIHDLRQARFGQSAERVDPGQLALALSGAPPTPPPASNDNPVPRGRKPHAERRRNRGHLPAHLERVEQVLDLADRHCPCCREEMRRIGEDRGERLDVVPAQLRVLVTVRPRYACRHCEEAGVHQQPAPARVVTGGLPTEALLVQVLVAKYGDGIPLHRQCQILARQGIQLDRATLCDWVGKACWWLRPLRDLILAHVVGHARVFADDTPLPTLERGLGRTREGRLWCYAADDRASRGTGPPAVAYVYARDRKAARPAAHLARFRGTLQVDGYTGFRALTAKKDSAVTLAFCWSHLRRRFHKIHAHNGSPIAAEALLRIGALYGIEREIRRQLPETRRAARQARSAPLVQALRPWLEAQLDLVSQGSALANAIRYGLRHWDGLCRYLEDGRLEMDTNTVEREIRPVATTRRAALFAGSEGGGDNWAIATTLVRTAILNGVNPQAWRKRRGGGTLRRGAAS